MSSYSYSLKGNDYKEDFKCLKQQLDFVNVAVPALYKQYADIWDKEGGAGFLDFGVDADFNFCIDGLVLVDTFYLKENKSSAILVQHPGRINFRM